MTDYACKHGLEFFNNSDGFGLALQAYQKRAHRVIDWLADLSERHQRKLMVRLVKGAYWDAEIKQAQVFKGMALYFMGKYDEAMEIEPFKAEFMERFKDQVDKRQQEKEQDDSAPGGEETSE